MIRILKEHALFGFIFSVAKLLVYFIPLLLADVLSTSEFGVLEYALAGLGMVVNTLFNLGVPGAYPYFILRKKNDDVKAGFLLHPIILLIPFIVNQVAYLWLGLDINFYLAFNISYIIANQVFYSTQLKSHEKSSFAVVLDSGIYIVLALFLLGYKSNIFKPSIDIINDFVLAYASVYVIIGLCRFIIGNKEMILDSYKAILRFSVHLLISTFLIFLITTSGRIIVEYFFGFEEVGIYAFYFRLAAIVVMIHQVINIAYFKKIYTYNPKILDAYFYKFFLFIAALSTIVYFLSPVLVEQLSDFFKETYPTYKVVYFILSAQMVMWIASALNSNIIDRENLARKNNLFFVLLILLGVFVLYIISDQMTFPMLVYVHYTSIFLACMIQFYSLSKKKIYFKKSAVTLSVIFIVQTCYYFLSF